MSFSKRLRELTPDQRLEITTGDSPTGSLRLRLYSGLAKPGLVFRGDVFVYHDAVDLAAHDLLELTLINLQRDAKLATRTPGYK